LFCSTPVQGIIIFAASLSLLVVASLLLSRLFQKIHFAFDFPSLVFFRSFIRPLNHPVPLPTLLLPTLSFLSPTSSQRFPEAHPSRRTPRPEKGVPFVHNPTILRTLLLQQRPAL
jgi:hypothetical protein